MKRTAVSIIAHSNPSSRELIDTGTPKPDPVKCDVFSILLLPSTWNAYEVIEVIARRVECCRDRQHTLNIEREVGMCELEQATARIRIQS